MFVPSLWCSPALMSQKVERLEASLHGRLKLPGMEADAHGQRMKSQGRDGEEGEEGQQAQLRQHIVFDDSEEEEGEGPKRHRVRSVESESGQGVQGPEADRTGAADTSVGERVRSVTGPGLWADRSDLRSWCTTGVVEAKKQVAGKLSAAYREPNGSGAGIRQVSHGQGSDPGFGVSLA